MFLKGKLNSRKVKLKDTERDGGIASDSDTLSGSGGFGIQPM